MAFLKSSRANEMGRTYLRPATGTGMLLKERFQHAPFGACFERRPSSRNFPFRSGQQPKLREIVYRVFFWSVSCRHRDSTTNCQPVQAWFGPVIESDHRRPLTASQTGR